MGRVIRWFKGDQMRGAGQWGWTIGMLGAGLVGAVLRLVDLGNRPMHPDEAVQALRFARLLEQGQYEYDPQEYHGPSLPYLSWAVVRAFGLRKLQELEAWHLRVVPAGIGILLVLGPWCLRRYLGRLACLVASWLTAISPALVFYSRYYIAEMLLVGFSWGGIVGWWGVRNWLGRFSSGPKQKLPFGLLVLLGSCLGLMYATKETWVIGLVSMLGGLWLTMPPVRAIPKAQGGWAFGVVVATGVAIWAMLFSSFGQNPAGLLDSLRTYLYYLPQAGGWGQDHVYPFWHYFQRLFAWKMPGGNWWTEMFVLLLALAGGLGAVGWRRFRLPARQRRLAQFLGAYTFIQAFIYSAIPYKTPWCALGFYHGMVVLAGLGWAAIWRTIDSGAHREASRFGNAFRWGPLGRITGGFATKAKPKLTEPVQQHLDVPLPGENKFCLPSGHTTGSQPFQKGKTHLGVWPTTKSGMNRRLLRGPWACLIKRGCLSALLLFGSGHLVWQAYRASFLAIADPTQPYLYAATTLEVAGLVATLEQIVQCHPDAEAVPIQVFFPDHQYWPLPWYLRRFRRVGWFGSFQEAVGSAPAPIILAHPDMEGDLREYCYSRQPPGQRRLYITELPQGPAQWEIRPHVWIRLYLRWDLWEAWREKISLVPPELGIGHFCNLFISPPLLPIFLTCFDSKSYGSTPFVSAIFNSNNSKELVLNRFDRMSKMAKIRVLDVPEVPANLCVPKNSFFCG
ncbi:MAG: TIGR03663 family protein [Thermoguttaceae bacterium]|nr:TIGR03663 family protein [Thermoguttaceae bacterium]MDW8038893.1 TIGR03663 family protein [Thermoguttaceae bacterium]